MKKMVSLVKKNGEKISNVLALIYFALMVYFLILGQGFIIASLVMFLPVLIFGSLDKKEKKEDKKRVENNRKREADFDRKYNRKFYGQVEIYSGKKVS